MKLGKHLTVATLGPAGTDAENEANKHFDEVVLRGSFPAAMEFACSLDACALVPAGYLDAHDSGIGDSWVSLHFRYLDRLELLALWESQTKPMCLAINNGRVGSAQDVRSVALHPATEEFAGHALGDGPQRTYVKAKPLAVDLAATGDVDACLGSCDVVERHPALTIVEVFTPTMVWCLYGGHRSELRELAT
jgi:hypothetical protein